MKKNYLSPTALVITTLPEEYCDNELSSNVVVDGTYEGGYIGNKADDILGDEV